MLKLLFIIALLYFSYRLFAHNKLPADKQDKRPLEDPDDYTDYEEID